MINVLFLTSTLTKMYENFKDQHLHKRKVFPCSCINTISRALPTSVRVHNKYCKNVIVKSLPHPRLLTNRQHFNIILNRRYALTICVLAHHRNFQFSFFSRKLELICFTKHVLLLLRFREGRDLCRVRVMLLMLELNMACVCAVYS